MDKMKQIIKGIPSFQQIGVLKCFNCLPHDTKLHKNKCALYIFRFLQKKAQASQASTLKFG